LLPTPDGLMLAALAGLAGAPHCIIMCGGIASSIATGSPERPVRSIGAYLTGKTIAYAGIGGCLGAAGSFINYAGVLVGVQGIASLLGGILLLMWTFGKYTLPVHRWNVLRIRKISEWLQTLRKRHGTTAVFFSGVLLGFIPCGLTYAMQIQAAASASWLTGFLLLAVFGVSTMPALLAIGLTAHRLGKKAKKTFRLLSLWLGGIMGVLSIMKGLSINGLVPSLHPWLW